MGLRETLRSRGLPQTTFSLRQVPSEELDAARRELDAVMRELRNAESTGAMSPALRQRVAATSARVEACFITLSIRALPPAELEEMLAEHPPTDAQREKGPAGAWNRDTFVPALLAACVFDDAESPEPALSAAEWADATTKGSMSLGEVLALFDACWQANDRTPAADLPKDLTPTRS